MPSSNNSTRGKSNTSYVFVLVCTLLAILLSIISLTIGVYCLTGLRSAVSSQRHRPSEEHVGTIACVKCDDGHWNWLSAKLSGKEVNGQERMCCAESAEQLSVLLEMTLSTPVESPPEPLDPAPTVWGTTFNLSKASAHRRLLSSKYFNSSIDHTPIFTKEMLGLHVNLTYLDEINEHVRGVDVVQTGFVIVHPGLYYVYSNVHFKPDSSQPCSSFMYQTWEQKVKKTSDESVTTILKSVHTCCDHCTRDKETSYAGGVFYLDKGDNLTVLVSGLGLVSFRTHSSYFGLAMLGEQ